MFRLDSRKNPIPMSTKVIDRIRMFDHLLQLMPENDGVIVECGVGHGRSLLVITTLSVAYRDRQIYAFDSFEGFPEVSEDDSIHNPQAKKGHYKSQLQDVKQFLMNSRMSADKVNDIIFVKGFFDDTLRDFDRPISFLHIDADLSMSYKTVLTRLFDKVSSGGIILFDEYNEAKWANVTRIVDEFMADKDVTWGEYRTNENEKYYVIKR